VKSLLIFGTGGHGRIVAETATGSGNFRVKGFADDDPKKHGLVIDDLTVFNDWRNLDVEEWIVAIGKNEVRKRVFEELVASGKKLGSVISMQAFVSIRASVGEGTVVLPGAVIQAGARIGNNVIINSGAVVDHDAIVHDHAHVGPNSTVASFGIVSSCEVVSAGTCRRSDLSGTMEPPPP